MKYLVLISALFVAVYSSGQFNKTNGYAQVTGGLLIETPKFGNYFKREAVWKGVVIRNRWLEMQIAGGEYLDVESAELKRGQHTYIGVHLPVLHKYAKGFRPMGMKGHLIQPFVAGGYSSHRLNESAGSVHLSPGISFQLPYVLAEFRLNGAYVIKDNLIKGYRGFALYPSLTFQFDGLLELFNPELVEGGTGILPQYENVWHEYDRYYDSKTGKNYSVGYYKNEITGWNSYTAYANDVKPFFALSPYHKFGLNTDARKASKISGLAFGGRWGLFAFDLMAGIGRQQLAGGFQNPAFTVNTDSLQMEYYNSEEGFLQNRNYNASSLVFQPELRVGVDLFRMLMGLVFPRGYGHENIQMATRFFRFHAGISGGYLVPMANFRLNNSDLELEFDEYLNANSIPKNHYNDPRESSTGYFLSAYGSVELGALGFSWMRSFYSSAPLANGRYYMVSYHIPIFRIAKAYRGKDL